MADRTWLGKTDCTVIGYFTQELFVKGGKYSGYMTVMKDFVPLLRARGIKQETLNRFLIENPARIFDKAD